jgi:hypothetical protein
MGNAKKVDVEVHIIRDSTKPPSEPPYDFWLSTKDSKVGKGKGNDLTFNNENKYDGFEIRFQLVDETGEDFLFMDDARDAHGNPDPDLAPMWVKTVSDFKESCPDHEFWGEFETTKVTGNNTVLEVRNWNKHEQKFKFALMFSRTPHQAPYEIMYDPDGTNQNGAHPFLTKSLLLVSAIGGAAVGTVVGTTVAPTAAAANVALYALGGALLGVALAVTVQRLRNTPA